MTVTFDGITLSDPEPFYIRRPTLTRVVMLLSGKTSVQTSNEAGFQASFRCTTEDFSDFTAIIAKVGTLGNLVIDGTTYANCAIIGDPAAIEILPGVWQYEVSFVQGTDGA